MKNYTIQVTGRSRNARRFALALILPSAASVADAAGFDDALITGKIAVDMRLRYEMVDQTGKTEQAKATPGRLRLGYGTADFSGVSAFAEFEHIFAIGGEKYNSTTNGMTDYPVVADPARTEVNQAWIAVDKLPKSQLKVGRQRIVLDNARFVGNVGWRQNEQTFDAVLLKSQPLSGATFLYGFVQGVNTITGGEDEMKSHLVHAGYQGLDVGAITAYGYLLDYAEKADSQTLGVRFAGARPLAAVKASYALEYASQSDYADNSASFSHAYALAEAGVGYKGINAKFGYELLAGDGASAFQTPLATKHAFNGWADQFLATPANGLVDRYLSVGTKLYGVKLSAIYHDFIADQGAAHYGSEWGLVVAKPVRKYYSLGLKYASYQADTHASDVDKLWLTTQFKF